MTNVTICIPFADYHIEQSATAIASAREQTEPCTVLYAQDRDRRGTGYMRNRLLEQVQTELVVFLDADDWIEPTFVQRCLRAYQPGKYVYTDWLEDETVKQAPDKCWCDGNWHVVTSLLRTEDVRTIGGFPEDLPAAEDTALYWQLVRRGICGLRVAEPLFHYGRGGLRAKTFLNSPTYRATMERIYQQYGGSMGCCGANLPANELPVGEKQPGDVMAMALWEGNRIEFGRVTRRQYPRTGNGKVVWMDPADARVAPHLWRIVDPPPPPAPPTVEKARVVISDLVDGIDGVMQALFPNAVQRVIAPTVEEISTVRPAAVKPDVKRVQQLARNKKPS